MRELRTLIYLCLAVWVPRRAGGRLLRRLLGRPLLANCGDDVIIEKGNRLHRKLSVGDRTQIGADCRFMIAAGVTLGDDVLLAPEVVFVDSNHRWDDPTIPIKDQGSAPPRSIVVEDGAWLGIRATILPGVRIGRGAVVGAGAVVSKDVEPMAIVAGNPARFVRFRV